MKGRLIIGLGYKARSGKDTVAAALVERWGFKRYAFADPLKEACREIFKLNDEQLYGSAKEKVDEFWKDTPRRILQVVGTECLRKGYADDVWVRALERRIVNGPERCVVTDVRFPNEAEAIQEWGGIVLRVDRPGAAASGGVAGHPSEMAMNAWAGWNGWLRNDGTLAELDELVDRMADVITRGLHVGERFWESLHATA